MFEHLFNRCHNKFPKPLGYGKVGTLSIMILLTALAVILQTSCSTTTFPDDPRVDRSLITGLPCEAPCWYGLMLEKSTIDDVRATLQQLEFVDQARISEQEGNDPSAPDSKVFVFDCVYSAPKGCGSIETSKGRLIYINLPINYPLSINTLIGKLGAPQYYSLLGPGGPGPEGNACYLRLHWVNKNINAGLSREPGKQLCSDIKAGKFDLGLQVDDIEYRKLDLEEIKATAFPWPNNLP